jgi:hypothetical protein
VNLLSKSISVKPMTKSIGASCEGCLRDWGFPTSGFTGWCYALVLLLTQHWWTLRKLALSLLAGD